jgi:hypothetical protein
MTPSPELLEIVLSEFQHALRDNLQYPWEVKHGKPPKYGYVEQTDWSGNELKMGKAIAAWHISPDAVRTSPIKNLESPKIDGMFFDLFRGWFCFSPDLTDVFINWQTGPRFGRGFKHRIGRDTIGRYLLDRGKGTWVS